MSASRKAIVMLLALAGGLSSPSAQAAAACTQDRFSVDGKTLATMLCPGAALAAAGVAHLPVRATFAVAGQSFAQSLNLRFPALAPAAHAAADVDLTPLGIAKTIHLTLRLRGESIAIDHALLLPGPTILR